MKQLFIIFGLYPLYFFQNYIYKDEVVFTISNKKVRENVTVFITIDNQTSNNYYFLINKENFTNKYAFIGGSRYFNLPFLKLTDNRNNEIPIKIVDDNCNFTTNYKLFTENPINFNDILKIRAKSRIKIKMIFNFKNIVVR